MSRCGDLIHREFASFAPRLSLALHVANAIPPYTANVVRVAILRAGGLDIGSGTGVGGRLWVGGGVRPADRLRIGEDCFVNDGCRFDVTSAITVADHVFLGHEVAVLTATHDFGDVWRRAGTTTAAPIAIGHGSWLGARSTILGGVAIGAGSVVAAGAVVTRSVPPNTLVGGVPAMVIRELDE